MKNLRLAFVLFFIGLCCRDLQAQVLKFQNLSSKDGLPSNEIFCLLQDSRGFLWLGTDNGLCRYDGYEFIIFRHHPNDSNSISSNLIKSIYEDANGFLWIGTDGGGLNIFNPDEELFLRYFHEAGYGKSASNRVYSICEDKNGFIWIGTHGGGLYNIDAKSFGKNYENLVFQKAELGKNTKYNTQATDIFKLYVDRLNNLWIGTSGDGVFVLSLSSFHANQQDYLIEQYLCDKNDFRSISGNVIRAIAEDHDGNIWIGTEFSGLNKFVARNKKFIRYQYKKGAINRLGSNAILSILEDSKRRLWIGSSGGGLMLFDNNQDKFISYFESPNDNYSIKGNLINTIFEDRFGNIWLGMVSTGVNLISQRKQTFEHFYNIPSQEKSLKGELVKSIFRDKSGNLWVGTYGGGLNLYKGNGEFKHYFSSPSTTYSISHDNVQKIYEDKSGRLWIGTDGGGLNLFNTDNQTFTSFQSKPGDSTAISGNSVWSICQDSKGSLWVGTYDGGLNKFDIERRIFKKYANDPQNPRSISTNDVRVVFEDRLGTLWVGTYGGGLNRFNAVDESFEVFKNNPGDSTSICGNKITCIFESPTTGQLWVGTFGGGISKFDRTNNTFQSYTEADGLSNNMVKSVEEDGRGNLWISTQKGISAFNPKNEQFTNYTTNDGLQDDAFSLGSSFKDKDGTIYFGGANGYNKFHPENLPTIFDPPKVYITEFLIQNRALKPGESSEQIVSLESSILNSPAIVLPYKFNSFSLKFVGIDFSFQDKIQYAYQLEGIDKDWNYIDGDHRLVSYSNLFEGTYIFQVKARIGNAPWSTPVSLPITIQPPLYRSNVAYFGYVVMLVILAWGIRKIINSRIDLRNQLKMERLERNKIKEINEFKINFFTAISHEIRTPLTLIKGPMEEILAHENLHKSLRNRLRTVNSNTNRLLGIVNQMLDFQKYDSGKIDLFVTPNDLVQYINGLASYFNEIAKQKNIHFEVFSSKDTIIAWFDKMQMEKVFFNLLSNAFKFTPENGRIHLYIGTVQEMVSVVVEDNGKGIPEKHIQYIFDRFYQVENNNPQDITSSGLGLAIAKEIIALHQGTIQVNSKLSEYTRFEILLPLDNKHFQASSLTAETKDSQSLLLHSILEEELEEEAFLPVYKYFILIIDDNSEILDFLSSVFDTQYKVHAETNPLQGLEFAQKELPDLIVLDLMMPEMDGLEVCKRLKENMYTSHIPVILLTAKDSLQSQLEGYELGADDYITKPFNVSLLKSRVKNLIDTRQKLREQFKSDFKLEPKSIEVTSPDQQLIKEMITVIEDNLSNQEFTIDDLAKKVGLSRAVFYRKLPKITGCTPNDFLRLMRLKRAAQLLKNSDLSVKEVSYQVGFNSPKYFSQKFKEEFGTSPVEYSSQAKQESN